MSGGSGTGTQVIQAPSAGALTTQMTTDLEVFFNSGDFAAAATYTHIGSIAVEISVLFDDAFQAFNAETGRYETSAPQAVCKASDVSGVAHRDVLVINSVTYYVTGIQPSDDGLTTTLILSKD